MATERFEQISARQTPLRGGESGELVGYKIEFTPAAHSEEEHYIEQELFRNASVKLEATPTGFAFVVANERAVARGRHDAENARRKRNRQPSLEEEAQKKAVAEEDAKKEPPAPEDIKPKAKKAK